MSFVKKLEQKYKIAAGDVINLPVKKREPVSKKSQVTMPTFTDGQHMTAQEKKNVFKAFVTFVNSDFNPEKFTKALYKYISLSFGFIAHYDLNGFYASRFANPEGRIKTYDAIANASHYNFNDDNTSGKADLNKAVHEFVVANKKKFVDDAKELKKQMMIEQHKQLTEQLKNMGHDV